MSGELINNSLSSLKRVVVGFLAAAGIGVGLGIILGENVFLRNILEPVIELLKPIPPIAWIPIAILLFGLGDISSYFIVFLGAFFPIFINTTFGVRQLPQKYKNLARTLEIGKYSYFKNILLKFSLPYIFTGLKIGIGMGWMSVIAAELIGAQSGLGYYIQMNRLLLRTDKIIVGMIVIGLFGYLLTKLIVGLENWLIPWRNDSSAKP
jgi:nitrate ABC transporter permease subunit